LGGGIGSKVHALVPSDAIVIDIDFSQHAHHFQLIVVVFLVGKGKGVGNFQDSIVGLKAQERASDHLRKRLVTVLDKLEKSLSKGGGLHVK
jgi:hypothetical protein